MTEIIIYVVLAFLAGIAITWLVFQNKISNFRQQNYKNQQESIRSESALQQQVQNLTANLAELKQEKQDTQAELKLAQQQYNQANLDLNKVRLSLDEKQAAFNELKASFEQSKDQMRLEFQSIAQKILEEKGKTFTQSSQSSLENLLKPFREQIEGFQKRVNDVHDATQKGQTQLLSEINQVRNIGIKISDEANNLTSALKGDKKTTGNWGEIQLERSLQLAGLVPGDHYEAQASFKDENGNRRNPDFIIKLPDDKHMVIDSKVSLVDYDRAVVAETDAERQTAMSAHVQAVRNHIDDLSKKDYSNLIGMHSPSFVLMFMPIEPAYIEAMKQNNNLFDYGYQRNVIMVSHTTLMPILRTVANLWMVARSNEQARSISDMAGDIYNQVVTVAERLNKLGNTLNTVNGHFNSTVTALVGQQGLYGKVNRFAELSTKANKKMPELEHKHVDIEVQKLQLVLPEEKPE